MSPTRIAPAPFLAVLTVVALLAPVYLLGIGTVDIVGDDEAREVGIIQDIAERGHWLLPRFNGKTFPDKPVLYHWLGAVACLSGGGCNETTVRLPSAISALVLIALTCLMGSRLFGPVEGVAAGLLLGLTPFVHERARVARPDMLVTVLIAAALFASFEWWRWRQRRVATLAGLLVGLAILAKGPVGPVIVSITVLVFLALRGQVRAGRELLRPHVLAPALLVGGSWYAIALIGWGEDFARRHLLGRYLGNVLGGDLAVGIEPSHSWLHHITFYPLHLLLGTLPWTPFFIVATWAALRDGRRRRDPRWQFLLTWVMSTVLVFSFAALKLRHYVLPALPAAALMAAPLLRGLVTAPAGSRRSRRGAAFPFWTAPALTGVLLLLVAAWWSLLGPESLSRSDRILVEAVAESSRAHPWRASVTLAVGALILTAAVHAALGRRWRAFLGVGTASMLLWLLVVGPGIQSAVAERTSLKPFAESVEGHLADGKPLFFFRRVLRPVVVYSHRVIPSLHRDLSGLGSTPAYVIATAEDVSWLEASGTSFRVVSTSAGRIRNLTRGQVLLLETGEAD